MDAAENAALPVFALGQNEDPCIAVQTLEVDTDISQFSFLQSELIKQSGFKPAMCLGTVSVTYLQKLAQNLLIGKGYLTSQALIEAQDLNTGRLKITVIEGKTGKIHRTNPQSGPHQQRIPTN